MLQKIELYHFVPSSKQSDFEGPVIQEVMPLVDMNPTRGGQVLGQALLKHADGRFIWAIAHEEIGGGSWYKSNISRAFEKLALVASIYATSMHSVITRASARDDLSVLPVGNSGSKVRIYEIKPQMSGFSDSFEHDVVEQVLPAVNLHPANRIGHSTDGLMFLKNDDYTITTEGTEAYLWLVSHTVFEQFEDRDNFPEDIRPALEKLRSVGEIYGFNDYQVLKQILVPRD